MQSVYINRRSMDWILLGILVLGASGCASWRVDKAAQTATGFASQLLCDDVFITGVDPDTVLSERIKPLPGMGLVSWGLKPHIDKERRELTVSIAGLFKSRARYRDHLGCTALPDDEAELSPGPDWSPPIIQPSLPEIAGSEIVIASNPMLAAVLKQGVVKSTSPARSTKAIIVMRDGKIVAEQYADGYGIDTPVLGFSMSKSITNALIGTLVRQGKLSLDRPAPINEWQDANDPRRSITVEHLLRQTSGLDLPQTNSGFDITSQIMYSVRDKASASGVASLRDPPGTHWAYTDTNFMLLSRIVRDFSGDNPESVLDFAHRELFGPLGMRSVRMDFDAAGTPIGSSHILASARDWARFGQLYLNDGVAGERRILPEGWVKNSATPTLTTGYGAGFWTNRMPGINAEWGVPWGLASAPSDTFFARGFMGNFVVVIPSKQTVIVRLSVAPVRGDDIEETDRLVKEILAALDAEN